MITSTFSFSDAFNMGLKVLLKRFLFEVSKVPNMNVTPCDTKTKVSCKKCAPWHTIMWVAKTPMSCKKLVELQSTAR